MTNLIAIAEEMRQDLERTHQAQTRTIEHADLDRECKLILRYGPTRQTLQAITVIWARQPPEELKTWLRAVFAIPEETDAKFEYQDGWGLMLLQWDIEPPPKPTQALLFDMPDPLLTGEAYYQI